MSTAPHVTVVIPAYRAEGTIAQALESVRRQSWTERDVVVVDDASPDRTSEAAQAWIRANGAEASSSAERGWRVVRLDRNRGPAGARNEGIRLARGEWVAFLDGDDAWVPWRLAAQFEALRHAPDAVLVCGDYRVMDELAEAAAQPAKPAPDEIRRACRAVALEAFLDDNPAPTSTVLARTEALRAAGGFDERFCGTEDIDLWMRVAAAGRIVKLDLPLALYRERPGSLSMDPDGFLPQILGVYEKAFGAGGVLYGLRRFRRRTIASRLTSSAWTCLACGRRLRGLCLLLRSWWVWPRRLKIEQRRPAWRLILLGKIVLNRP